MNVIIGAEQKKSKEKVEKVKTKCFVYRNNFVKNLCIMSVMHAKKIYKVEKKL